MAKKAKIVRKTLREKLDASHLDGWDAGHAAGKHDARFEFRPNCQYQEALTAFARNLKLWPIGDNAVVALVGTDLKHICNLAISGRIAKAIATELERLGYK